VLQVLTALTLLVALLLLLTSLPWHQVEVVAESAWALAL
jgi:hypothetical protein